MNFKILILMLLGIWIGVTLGISFIEAPLKFRAPGITMKLGVGIGRLVFMVSNYIQLGILLMALVYYLWNYYNNGLSIPIALYIVALLLGFHTFYLLPILDDRAIQWLSDQQPQASHHHILFILTEVFKVILLCILFYNTYQHE